MEIQNIRTHNDNSGGYKYTHISIKREVSFWLLPKTPHTSIIFFLQTKIFILTHEGLRSAPHQCSWPEGCSSFCVFGRINRERPTVCDGREIILKI